MAEGEKRYVVEFSTKAAADAAIAGNAKAYQPGTIGISKATGTVYVLFNGTWTLVATQT